jgi:hypothetical protein
LHTRDKYVYVESPQIVQSPPGVYLIGTPAFAFTGLDTRFAQGERLSGALIQRRGGVVQPLPLPPGAGRMSAPRATLVPDGTLHVLWVPADSIGQTDRSAAARLWTSRREDGAWTKPVALFEAQNRFAWSTNRLSAFVSSLTGPQLVGPYERGSSTTIGLVRWKRDHWEGRICSGFDHIYPQLAPRHDTLLVFASVEFGAPDGNALFVRRSIDCASWSPPVRVSPPGTGAVYDPAFVATADESLTLVWAAQAAAGVQNRIYVATSRDTGTTWQVHPPATVAGGFAGLRAASDSTGRIHVLVTRLVGDRKTPLHRFWQGGRWSEGWSPAGPPRSVGIATIGSLGGDSVMAVWGESVSRTTTLAPTTLWAIGSPACTIRSSR